MGSNQFPNQFNWQSTSPVPFVPNTPPNGVTSGVMSGTSVIYSQILDLSRYANTGLEVNYTGTATGTIQIMGSNSGQNFYPLTFSPVLAQPAGSSGGYLIDLNNFPFKFLMIQYTNSSGTGVLTVYGQNSSLS